MAFLARWSRRALFGLSGVLLLALAALALLQTTPVATWLGRRLAGLAPLTAETRLGIGRVSGSWISGLALHDVLLERNGRRLAAIRTVRVAYNPLDLLGAERRLAGLTVEGARIHARREAGAWDIASAFRPSSDTAAGGSFAVERLELRDAALVAELASDSIVRVEGLELRARELALADPATVVMDSIDARILPPTTPPTWLTLSARGAATEDLLRLDTLVLASDRSRVAGRAALPRGLDDERVVDQLAVELAATPLALGDLAVVVPAVAPDGELALELRADAVGRRVSGRLRGQLGEASIRADGSTVLGADVPAEYRLVGQVRGLDPASLAVSAPAGRINADAAVNLIGPALDRANGKVELRVTDSRIGQVSLSRLLLQADLTGGRAEVDLRGAVDRGTVRASGWLRPFDSVPSYRLAGTAARLRGTDSVAPLLAGPEGDPHLAIGFRVSGTGTTADDAEASGRITLTGVRADGTRTPLGGASLELAQRRLELRPELLLAGGKISATATARLDQPVSYRIRRGVIQQVDLGRLMGDTVAVPVSGRFALSGEGAAPDEAKVRGELSLDEVRYAARRLEETIADLALDRGRATVAVRGGLQGGRVALDLLARPFDSIPAFTIRRATVEGVDLGTLLGRPDLAGPVTARLTGAGRWGATTREFRGRLGIEPSTMGAIAVHRGEVATELAAGRLRYDASLVTDAGAISAAGDGRPLDPEPSFALRHGRADSLDLGALLGREGLATRIDVRFSAQAAGTKPDSMRARVELDLLPSRLNQVAIRAGRARLALDRGALEGQLRMESADGELSATLDGTAAGAERRLRADGTVRLDRLARWTGDTARDGNLAGRFSLAAMADTTGLLSLAGTITANGRLDSVRLDTLRIALSPEPRMLMVDTVVVRSNVAALDGGGRLLLRGTGGADTLRLAGTLNDPMPLVALAGADSLSLDSARVRLAITGPAELRRVAAEGAAHRLLSAGSQVERITLAATAALDSAGLSGAEGEVALVGGAVGSVVVREARLAGRYDSVVSLQAAARLRDDISLDATLRGVAAGDTVQGTLERLDLAEGGRRWALERPAGFTLQPSRYEIDDFALRAGESLIAANGVLDRKGLSDLALALRRVELAPLRQLGFAPVGGRLEGDLRLAGPADDPSLAGQMLATIRSDGNRAAGRLGGKLRWTAAGLELEAEAVPEQGGRLTVAGSLPVGLTLAPEDSARAVGVIRRERDTLGLTVQADSFGLAFFQPLIPPATAEGLRGTLAIDGQISGTMEQPRAGGTLAVSQFGVTLPALGLSYLKGELAGRLAEDRFQIERLRLVTDNDGELTAQGSLRLTPLTDPALDLTAELREFRVSHSAELRTIASGRLQLQGTAAVPVMTGRLSLGRTDIFAGSGGAAGAVEQVELTAEELQQLAREFGPSVLARAQEGPGLVHRFRMDLEVRLPGRVWFRQRGNVKADIEVAGRVRVRQEPGEAMQFFGEVRPVPGRGVMEMYGRQFRLEEGEITLAGPTEAAELTVTTHYRVPSQADPDDDGILIDVHATGRPDSIALAFSSEPAMSDEDIVSYIVTGRPASENPLARQETGEGPGAAERGVEVAFGRLSESVAGAAGEALGLDVFQIRQDGLRGLTLTAGRYVGSRLFFSLQQPIQLSSDARQQSSNTTLGPGFELEYTLRRWLRANLQGGNLAPRFFLRGRHAF